MQIQVDILFIYICSWQPHMTSTAHTGVQDNARHMQETQNSMYLVLIWASSFF